MNKGLQIWHKKKQRKRKTSSAAIRKRRKGQCKFICYVQPQFKRVNGRTCFSGRREIRGLQIDSTLFYLDGEKIRYISIDKRSGRILEVYTLEEALNSSFVNEELIKKYEEHINANETETV